MNLHKILNADNEGSKSSSSLPIASSSENQSEVIGMKAENIKEKIKKEDITGINNDINDNNDNDESSSTSSSRRQSQVIEPNVGSSRKRTIGESITSTSDDSKNDSSPYPVKTKIKRVKAKNSTWTIEEDRKLISLVISTLPIQDFNEYARVLNKRDAQTVRYRWKVILRRARAED